MECLKHGLVEPFGVFWEKEGQFSIMKILCYCIYLCIICMHVHVLCTPQFWTAIWKKKSVKTENGESGGWEKSVHYTHVDMTISLADRAKIKA